MRWNTNPFVDCATEDHIIMIILSYKYYVKKFTPVSNRIFRSEQIKKSSYSKLFLPGISYLASRVLSARQPMSSLVHKLL